MAKLQKCPFCGGDGIYDKQFYIHMCKSCGATGPVGAEETEIQNRFRWNDRYPKEVKPKPKKRKK